MIANLNKGTMSQCESRNQISRPTKPISNATPLLIFKVFTQNDYERNFRKLQTELKQSNGKAIELSIRSQFETDKDLVEFYNRFIKLKANIRYLNWLVIGPYTVSVSAYLISECIKIMPNLYRLNLRFDADQFFENGVTQLSQILPTLQDLRVLNISLSTSIEAKNLLNEGINSIPNLELVIYSDFQATDSLVSSKLASYSFNIAPNENMTTVLEKFSTFTDSVSSLLVHLSLRNDFPQEMIEEDMTAEIFEQNQKVQNLVLLKCFQLPFLTAIQQSILIFAGSNVEEVDFLLLKFLREKRSAISQLRAFNQIISPFLSVNPNLVAIDLFF